MKLSVQLFAGARELAATDRLQLELPEGATVGDLRVRILEHAPALARYRHSLWIAVNNDYADDARPLNSADEVACFPPVSGG